MIKKIFSILFLIAVAISAYAQPQSREELERQRQSLKKEIEETESLLNNNKLQTKENLLQFNLISKKVNLQDKVIDNINKDINLNKMSFNNVGTAEKSTKFKEVLQMVFANVLLNINNEVIQGDLKNKIKEKVKNLKNKISPESLKKLERTFR
jgi:hypothetical protein